MRIGILETIDNKTMKLVGYGFIDHEETVISDDLGIEINAHVVALENGSFYTVIDQRMAEDYIIDKEIDAYKAKGINVI